MLKRRARTAPSEVAGESERKLPGQDSTGQDITGQNLSQRPQIGEFSTTRPRVKQCALNRYALVSSDAAAGRQGGSKNTPRRLTVQRYCAECARAGIRTGMDLALARALLPTLAVHPFDPQSDLKALTELARWMGRLSPLVGIDPELAAPVIETKKTGRESQLFAEPLRWGILVDLTGTARLHGETEALLDKLTARLTHVGVEATLAVAPTIGGAWALARFAGQTTVHIADTKSLRATLALLPIEALRLPPLTRTALHEVGVVTIGELLKIPPRTLTVRFGHVLLNRLDQALGRVEESFRALPTPTIFRATARFDPPLVHHAALERTIVRLIEKLLKRLAESGHTARTFFIYLAGHALDRTRRSILKTVNLTTATTDLTHLTSIVAPIIEAIRFEDGAELVAVAAENVERALHAQGDFLADPDATIIVAARNELLNTLTVRLGEERVRRATFHSSHIPERSCSFEPVRSGGATHLPDDGVTPLIVDRPPHLFSPPEPAKAIAMLPDRPPSWIDWRQGGGKIIHGTGPERISPEWWHGDVTAPQDERDYFKVQTEHGAWLWVFRNNRTHAWFVHGIWV